MGLKVKPRQKKIVDFDMLENLLGFVVLTCRSCKRPVDYETAEYHAYKNHKGTHISIHNIEIKNITFTDEETKENK